ncbi:disulfide bond formation protein DsbA [Microbacterium oryzae]|uniref:Disulfide bond formation protein DsbA n=1 Tax=Microbacterium oryzae TaxID=743009 RepID=A0A6I6DV54_9MICO|nr:disulfide bond formation protein DsbA [Microbacterium oryzae]
MPTPVKATLIAAAVVIVLVIVAIVYVNVTRPAPVTPDEGALPGTRSDSHVLDEVGPDAPTLVEFLDFECEACGAFYPYVEEIREQYAGEINYVVRYFPLPGHFNSMNAALAVEAASQQDRFEEMYDRMFETQIEWGEGSESEADRFRGYAEELGLDMDAYDEAVADPATQERVEEDFLEGQEMGVTGTPTFFLDGEKLELNALTDLTDALDRAIAD